MNIPAQDRQTFTMAGYRPTNAVVKEAREDVDLLRMALAQMWPVPQENKQELIDRQMEIVRNDLLPGDVRNQAARNIMAAGIANLKALELLLKCGIATAMIGKEKPERVASDSEIVEGLQRMITEVPVENPVTEEPVESPAWRLHA